ncbi:ATP-binding protein [Candidatus Thorarchaeota archaeon]|nr:MAG: ATP-binding protein [Candidatus Thorarchaeota archaeon]
MGEERTYAEVVSLVEPENLLPTRLSQYSVATKAMEQHVLVKRFDAIKKEMTENGLEFGGRTLLIGPPGTDFEAFSHYLCREVPLKMVRFRMEEMLKETKGETSLINIGFEFARRHTPALVLIERLESIIPKKSIRSAILQDELKRTSWDNNEILVVATTTRPQDLDIESLESFDRTYVFDSTTMEDRVRVFEQILKNREDIDPTLLAELTDNWGFSDVKRLAISLFMKERDTTDQISRNRIEELIEESGVIPLTNSQFLSSLSQRTSGIAKPKIEELYHEYPDDFLDQLYLLAVSEDYANTQRVIEVLNEGMPLSKPDHEFLSRHPYLLNGSPEDRLTRLLRAKKSSDRLQRIMGR